MKKVAVIMGSDSDWAVVKGACEQLKAFGIPFEAHILSAHRTPAAAAEFASAARSNGFGVLLRPPATADHLARAVGAHSTVWTRCCPPCRCPAASPWPPWLWAVRRTPQCWQRKSWPSATTPWPPSWTRPGQKWPVRSPERKPASRRSWHTEHTAERIFAV